MSLQGNKLSVKMILKATGGILVQGNPQASLAGVCADSRSIKPGEVFFALRGERHDGHQFVPEAVSRGARAVVVKRKVHGINDISISVIKVRDTLRSLGDLANFWRRAHPIPLVAITGSNGKTTTKEMLAEILAERYKVLKNPGNFNNLIGLPLSLLKLNSRDQVAVLEMGMNRKGEIRRLAQIAEPNIGILTNISPVHLEGLRSLRGVSEAKGELLEVMGKGGKIVFNADDPMVVELSKRFRGKRTSFGIKNPADWAATEIRTERGKIAFLLNGPVGETSISLRLIGKHQVYNALAAAAAASHLGVGLEEIKKALEAFQPPSMRMELVTLGKDIKIINDAYNANPKSMEVALSTLEEMKGGRKIAVLGDMWELGDYAVQAHIEIGHRVKKAGVKVLFLLGKLAPFVAKGAMEAGMDPEAIFIGKDHREIGHHLSLSLKEGDWVLIKGSRIMKMEGIIETLRDKL